MGRSRLWKALTVGESAFEGGCEKWRDAPEEEDLLPGGSQVRLVLWQCEEGPGD